MRNILNKFVNKKGESLAEVLVAILITGVALLMVSSMIYASTKMVAKGDAKMTDIYNGINAMENKGEHSGQSYIVIKRASGALLPEEIKVDIYTDEKSGLMSYAKAGGTQQ